MPGTLPVGIWVCSVQSVWPGKDDSVRRINYCRHAGLVCHLILTEVFMARNTRSFWHLTEKSNGRESCVKDILDLLETSTVTGLYRVRSTTIAKALASLAEAINGRITTAERILRGVKLEGDPVISAITNVIAGLNSQLHQRSSIGSDRIKGDLDVLAKLAYADIARLLTAVHSNVAERLNDGVATGLLTRAELDVVRLLADGLTPKEIAARTERSVFTISVHIANVSAKLGCHGRSGAVRRAQELGLL